MDLAKIVAKRYMLVRRFQSISGRIKVSENNKCLLANQITTYFGASYVKICLWGTFAAKFFKLFYEANWNMMFWEINC